MADLHTDVVDGVEIVGVLFNSSDGLFYEFQDPDGHDAYARFECPRTGEVIENSSKVEMLMGDVLSGHVRATVPLDQWVDFREYYVDADGADHERWTSMWEEMAENDPRFEGGVDNA